MNWRIGSILKSGCIFVVLAAQALCLAGCEKSKQSLIVGSWQNTMPGELSPRLTFTADGAYNQTVEGVTNDQGTWRVDGNDVVMVPKMGLAAGKEARMSIVQLDHDKLVLQQMVMNLAVISTYQRVGG